MTAALNNPFVGLTTFDVRRARLIHTALHEAAHCVIACDVGYHVTQVKLDRKKFKGWMVNSNGGDDWVKDAQICLAGVAFEGMVWGSYAAAKPWCGNDAEQAFELLSKKDSGDWFNPILRDRAETVALCKRELERIKLRLTGVWPVIEYVAALILKNREPVFPINLVRWSNQVRRCINDEKFLSQRAAWANGTPPIGWLQQLGEARNGSG